MKKGRRESLGAVHTHTHTVDCVKNKKENKIDNICLVRLNFIKLLC